MVRPGLGLPVEDGFTQRRSEVVPNWSSSLPVEIRLSESTLYETVVSEAVPCPPLYKQLHFECQHRGGMALYCGGYIYTIC